MVVINVGPQGTFRRSGEYHTTPADVDAWVAALHAAKPSSITLHFHGGLVSEAKGLELAGRLSPVYSEAGTEPVVFVWETGLMETISRNLPQIVGSTLVKVARKYVTRHIGRLLGIPGARGAGIPLREEEVEELLRGNGDALFESGARSGAASLDAADLDELERTLAVEIHQDLETDPDQDLLARASGERGVSILTVAQELAAIAIRVVARFRNGRDHGLRATLLEEILRQYYLADVGAEVWGHMKRVAKLMWEHDPPLQGEDQRVGAYVLERLSAWQQETGGRINIVGHSAGSIAIQHFLTTASERHPHLEVSTVIFMAPAITHRDFANSGLLDSQRIPRLSVFTMADEDECQDELVPVVYPRSLLYLISGILEDEVGAPLLGMHRHLLHAPDTSKDVVQFLQTEERLVLAQRDEAKRRASPPGRRSGAMRHGDFDEDPDTLESIQILLRTT